MWLLVRVSEEVVECGCWLVEVVIGEVKGSCECVVVLCCGCYCGGEGG